MHLEYNGREMQLLTLDRVERSAVWTPDGVDLMFVRWRIGCSCVYAPGATALEQDDVFPGTVRTTFSGDDPKGVYYPDAGFNTLPIVTDIQLRKELFRNRKKLRVWGYNEDGTERTWLESPVPPSTCDADNGPKVHSCTVVSAAGAPSNFAVQLEIETCLPPCPEGSDRPLLSHRWQMQHTHDEDFYLTRSITGQAIFHPGLLDKYAKNPDWFRAELFHPIPLGFQRLLGPITLSSDGCVLNYEYSDRETTVMFNAGDSGATHIDIQEKFSYVPGNVLRVIGLD